MNTQNPAHHLLSIIIPVYNEQRTVAALVDRVQAAAVPIAREIILVDDGSTDGTTELIANTITGANIVKRFHTVNRGKGAALP